MAANQSAQIHLDPVDIDVSKDSEAYKTLLAATDQFIKHTNETVEIWAASRDWFLEEWGRDTFISLPGLLLATERFDEAKQVFEHFAEYEKDGIIPNRIWGGQIIYNTVDGSLWFIDALRKFYKATNDEVFIREMLPTIRNILRGYLHGAEYEHFGKTQHMGVNEKGFVTSPAQTTWMDADPSGNGTEFVTPRDGACVEINALWYSALQFAMKLEDSLQIDYDATDFRVAAELLESNFADSFWNDDEQCLLDVIDGDPHRAAIRPNQVFALTHAGSLLSLEQRVAIFEVVTRELLTPGGLRTLSPRDSQYKGLYQTELPPAEKDWAYHQGTIWPWLIGPYCDALKHVRGEAGIDNDAIQHELKSVIAPLAQYCLDSEHKSLPEVFSGDPPHEPGGTTSQAWSVAEVFRIVKELAR